MKKSILIINNKKLEKTLNEVSTNIDYQIIFSDDCDKGLEILDKEEIHLIIVKMVLPGIVEYKYLEKIKFKYPKTIRMITIPEENKKESIVLQSISEGIIKSYITEPWDSKLLIKEIDSLFNLHESLNQKAIHDLINQIDQLPVLPSLYQKVMSLIQNYRSIQEIADVIENEPSYVSKILKIVNSACYGGKISTIKQALLYLGTDTIKNVILTADVFEYFRHTKVRSYDLDLLWDHFNICNRIMQRLYHRAHSRNIVDKFALTGLLHDVGKLLILKYFPDQFNKIWQEKNKNPDACIIDIEKEILCVSHAELGAYLLDWWKLPKCFVEVCLHHHDPLHEKIINKELVSLIHISDIYSWKKLKKFTSVKVIPETFQRCQLTPKEVKEVVDEVDIYK